MQTLINLLDLLDHVILLQIILVMLDAIANMLVVSSVGDHMIPDH